MKTAQAKTRRDAIAAYGAMDGMNEPDLQGLVRLAATICGKSRAVVNIIDDHAQHQVAAVGFEAAVCTIEESMCAVVLKHPQQVVVSDARLDARFAENPFVTGEIGHVRFYASSPLVTPGGVAIGTLCVFDEETGELVSAQTEALDLLAHQVVDVLELRRISRELGRSNEQLAHFAGQVSHDLRNPLTALIGYIEIAADSPELTDAPQVTRALGHAESAATRMEHMVSDLLEYARLGGAQPRREKVALQETIGAALDDLSAALTAAGAVVAVDADVEVTGDPTLLRVLFQNLVANAVKFTHAAGTTPFIEIEVERLTAGWRISVDDNGPGVAPEQRDRVFELMERSVGADIPGLGIGLSTCRRIVEGHGGQIGISESALGGASIWMILPD